MSIVVTGAAGKLGRLIVEALLARGVAPDQIVATARDTGRLADLSARGVQARRADFAEPESLGEAFAGATALVLVSTDQVGTRLPNHRNAVDAAAAAGVAQLVYTSFPYAETTSATLAEEHRDTERYIAASGVPSTILRNSWYWENYTGQLASIRERGALFGSAGDGLISAAARADYADAAAVVASSEGHVGSVYELGGEPAVTMTQIAAAFADALGQPVVYTDVPEDDYEQALRDAGVPDPMPAIMADVDVHTRAGALFTDSGDLTRLIGRPTVTLEEAVQAAVAAS